MNRWFGDFILFLVSPIVALTLALSRIRQVGTRNIIWLFCGFYGLCFFLDMDAGVDSVYYATSFKEMYASSISWDTLSSMFYQEGERHFDIFAPITAFVVSRITDDHRLFFGVVGFVFGFFYSRFLYFFIDRLNFRTDWMEWFFVTALAFALDVGTGINGVRMYTALFVFLSGAVHYWESRRTVYLLWAMSSVFFHFSFAIPVAVLLAQKFFNGMPFLVYVFFLASFVVAEIEVAQIRSFVQAIPGLEGRVAGYMTEGYERETPTWLLGASYRMMQLFLIVNVSYFYFTFISQNRSEFSSILIFAMALYGLINLGNGVASLARFHLMGFILVIGYLLLQFNRYRKEVPEVSSIGSLSAFLLVLQTALGIRFFVGFANTNLLFSNPIAVWFMDVNDSLYDFFPKLW